MAVNNAYAAYKNSQIQTASPAELTLMLYEGAIKFCNIALAAMEKKDYEKAHNNIMKVEKIIEEFQATLNYKYEVANDFNNIYVYIYRTLIEANIAKDPALLEEALEQLRGMRDTWKEVMRRARKD